MDINWTWLLAGMALGLWGVPFVLGLIASRRRPAAANV